MTTTVDKTAPANVYRVIGTRPIRHDGYDKVTGRAKYGADVHMAGLLEGAILRSPHAHARIRSIDTSKAEALPGVRAVMTGNDLPEKAARAANFMEVLGSPQVLSENAMARDKALYKGHAVAAVAAVSIHVAEEALALIKVDYEPLPYVQDVREAMKPDAPILHGNIKFGDEGKEKPSNIAAHNQLKQGDVEEGFREADVIVEREFETKPVHQGYIEPHNSTASWSEEGNLTIWKSTQGPFIVRHQVAAILNIPPSRVKIVPMEIGGGFGGKIPSYVDAVTAVLARKSGHPVKIVMSRKDVFEGTGPASATYLKCKVGATKDGRITAMQVYLAFAAGAFPGSPVGSGSATSLAPYKVENLLVDGYDVVMNTPKVAAYRAPGSPQAAYAVECVIDELVEKLGMDPMEFRLKNATRTGDRQASGVAFPSIGCVEVEQAIKDHPHYKSPLKGANQGRGVAMGYWGNAGMQSSVTLNVTSDGTITLISGSVDIGGSRVALAMQAAEVLGIEAEDVHPSVGDTDSVGYTGVTGGSRTAFATGLAVIAAAEDAKQQMIQRAAVLWETQPEDVDYRDGVFTSKKNPEEKMTFGEMASKLMGSGGLITASASADPKQAGPSFSGMIIDVEVDKETGKVDVLRTTMVQDVGKAAHPSYVEGQMQGGAVQGIGWALNEEYFYNEEGGMANSSFLDYRMPTSLDLPMIDAVIVEVPNPTHPFGIRGVGESSIISPMAAVSNAVSRATGVRFSQLPMSPGVILEVTRAQTAKE
jgi:xanthine dehydrogenase molybdenum-binding subunit